MKLEQLQGIKQINKLTKLTGTIQSKNLKPLSSEEQSMIEDKFPTGRAAKLDLYISSGQSRTEIPGSKGLNFDFKI